MKKRRETQHENKITVDVSKRRTPARHLQLCLDFFYCVSLGPYGYVISPFACVCMFEKKLIRIFFFAQNYFRFIFIILNKLFRRRVCLCVCFSFLLSLDAIWCNWYAMKSWINFPSSELFFEWISIQKFFLDMTIFCLSWFDLLENNHRTKLILFLTSISFCAAS